jgi:hypothetical protein
LCYSDHNIGNDPLLRSVMDVAQIDWDDDKAGVMKVTEAIKSRT